MSDGKNVKVKPFDISQKITLFWGYKGHNRGSKWVKIIFCVNYETKKGLFFKLVIQYFGIAIRAIW